jgi:alpha-galactosidase
MLAQGFSELWTGRRSRAQKVGGALGFALCAAAVWMDGAHAIDLVAIAQMHSDLQGDRMAQQTNKTRTDVATAARLISGTDAEGFPAESAWETAPAVRFNADWQGLNADPGRETEVRMLWTPETLYLRFDARYRTITVFPDGDVGGRRDHLWDRDVCEVFLQPDAKELRRYKEFEIAPNGFWIDLDIGPGAKHDLQSGLQRRVKTDEAAKRWEALLALPMKSLVERFDPSAEWRVNFYRVEGPSEPRFYSAWQPTHTPQPNFHVPEAFGRLVFADAPKPN